jgi:hypothetical protein
MQRVAIFKLNWGQRLALLIIFALSILVGTLFVNTSHASADSTYKTETSDNLATKIEAFMDSVKSIVAWGSPTDFLIGQLS